MKHPNLFGALLAAVFPFLLGAPASAQLLQDISPVPGGDWQITWKSEAGVEYTVQRSADLENWFDLETVTATASETTFVDTTAPAAQQFFWRLSYDDDGPVLLTPFSIIEVVKVDSEGNAVSPNTPGAHWRITWESQSGAQYTLQRAPDGQTWTDVATVTATADTTSHVDTEAPDVPLLLWRVLGLSAGGGLQISEILPQFSTSGGANSASLGVIVGGDVPIQSVTFFDGTTALGEALPGPGGAWTFPIQWDPDTLSVVNLSVQVTPLDGDPVTTDPVGLLVADPSRFVPIGPDGAPRYGQFIPVDGSGNLGAFYYYPEGVNDRPEATGAHLRVEAGAQLAPQATPTSLQFSDAQFSRGPTDDKPLLARAGVHQLDLAAIDQDAVQSCFDVPAGEPVRLLWGDTEVPWSSGALGADGWSALAIIPELGEFGLPGVQASVTVSFDPADGAPILLACFHGEWHPVPGGATSFRVPAADPLKIYLPLRGGIAAHGTVEAIFPDGATLRGSVSWRAPVFEFSFEGKGFVIPALGTLREELPADPLIAAPATNDEADLDAASENLLAYRNMFRSMNKASLTLDQDGTLAGTAPLGTPSPTTGSALEGWAWRVRSWEKDRSGETLSPEASDELLETITGGTKTAEAATDLPTSLKLLRDYLLMKDQLSSVVDAGQGLPADFVAANEARLFSTADRILRNTPDLDLEPEFPQVAVLLVEVLDLSRGIAPAPVGPVPRGGAEPTAVARSRALREALQEKVTYTLFENNGIDGVPGISLAPDGAPDNPILKTKTIAELHILLRSFVHYLEVLDAGGIHVFDVDPNTACRALALEQLGHLPHIADTFAEIYPFLRSLTESDAAAALQSSQNSPDNYESFKRLRAAVANYATFFWLHREVGLPQSATSLTPSAVDLADAFSTEALYWDSRVDPEYRGNTALTNLDLVRVLSQTTFEYCSSGQAGLPSSSFEGPFESLVLQNDQVQSEIVGNPYCEQLRNELIARLGPNVATLRVTLPAGDNLHHEMRLSGRYASEFGSATQTLQLSQGGRFCTGHLQHHVPGRGLGRSVIKGLLVNSSPTKTTYAYLRLNTEGIIMGAGYLTATEIPDGDKQLGIISFHESNPEAGATTPPVARFEKISNAAPLSDTVINLFSGEARKLVRAQQRAPLHPSELNNLKKAILGQNQNHDGDSRTPGVQLVSLVGQIVAAEADLDEEAHRYRVEDLDRCVGFMTGLVPTELIPSVQSIVREFLSKTPFPGNTEVTSWRQLMEIYGSDFAFMPHTQELLGLSSEQGITHGAGYLYEFDFTSVTFGIDTPVIPGFGLGATGLDITVKKTAPDGSNNHNAPWKFVAALGQVGFGFGPIDLPVTFQVSADNALVNSLFDYSAEDIRGGITIASASLTAAVGVGESGGFSSITFYPEGNKPPLLVDPGNTSTVYGINAGLGVDYSVGWVFGFANGNFVVSSNGIADNLVDFEAEATGQFEEQFGFAEDQSTLTPCGWQSLREFVAEYRNLLDQPDAQIDILGFTDTTQSTLYNDILGENRAQTVASALSTILGTELPDDRVTAFSVGELAALDSVSTGTINLEFGAWAPLVLQQRSRLGVIPDDTPDADWRNVTIIINKIITTSISGQLKQ